MKNTKTINLCSRSSEASSFEEGDSEEYVFFFPVSLCAHIDSNLLFRHSSELINSTTSRSSNGVPKLELSKLVNDLGFQKTSKQSNKKKPIRSDDDEEEEEEDAELYVIKSESLSKKGTNDSKKPATDKKRARPAAKITVNNADSETSMDDTIVEKKKSRSNNRYSFLSLSLSLSLTLTHS